MIRKNLIKLAAISVIIILGIGIYSPKKANSETKICPNSSVKCEVTFNHEEYGKITVASEKGKNDSAISIESSEPN